MRLIDAATCSLFIIAAGFVLASLTRDLPVLWARFKELNDDHHS